MNKTLLWIAAIGAAIYGFIWWRKRQMPPPQQLPASQDNTMSAKLPANNNAMWTNFNDVVQANNAATAKTDNAKTSSLSDTVRGLFGAVSGASGSGRVTAATSGSGSADPTIAALTNSFDDVTRLFGSNGGNGSSDDKSDGFSTFDASSFAGYFN